MASTNTRHRNPYVGAGEDGARRSARIDRDEADGLSWLDPRRDELVASAQRWEQQAHELVLDRLGVPPSLADVWASVGSEEWLAALALLDLSPVLIADAGRYAEWSRDGGGTFSYEGEGEDQVSTFHPNPVMAWDAWVADVDEQGRGWSTTEWQLFDLIAALVVDGRALSLHNTLRGLGSWERQALDVLVGWASGGNYRDRPGRYTVQPT